MLPTRAITGAALLASALTALLAAQCGAFGGSDSAPPGAATDAGPDAPSIMGAAEAGLGGCVGALCCVGNLCDCDGNAANGTETDVTQNDAKNCGACNHACPIDPVLMKAKCQAGVCSAAPVLQSLPYATVVAARGDDVYFADGTPGSPGTGTVWSAPAPGFVPAKISIAQPQAVTSLAVDDTDVYVVSSQHQNGLGYLLRMPRSGDCAGTCSTPLEIQDTSGIAPLQVTLSADAVYWVRAGSGNAPGDLMKLLKGADAGSGAPVDTRAGYRSAAAAFPTVVASGGFVYAAHQQETGVGSTSTGIAALPLGGCPPMNPQCVTDRVTVPTAGLAADKSALYYVELGVDGGANTVGRVMDTEATGTPYIAGRAGIGNVLAVDDRDIYWIETEASGVTANVRLLRTGKDGKCPTYAPCPQVVARETCSDTNGDPTCGISAIAIGDTQVFYARGGKQGGVFHLPK